MNLFDKLISSLSSVITIICFFVPDISFMQRLVIILLVLLVCFIALFISQLFKYHKLQAELESVNTKHRALGKQFDGNRDLINRYRIGIANIALVLTAASQTTNATKIAKVFESFLAIQNQINDGGVSNE